MAKAAKKKAVKTVKVKDLRAKKSPKGGRKAGENPSSSTSDALDRSLFPSKPPVRPRRGLRRRQQFHERQHVPLIE